MNEAMARYLASLCSILFNVVNLVVPCVASFVLLPKLLYSGNAVECNFAVIMADMLADVELL